ncbi:MAG TPA: TadE/TadG family type IV pilus assembly protein [Nevskiales bacterium]|nr:TadE/TadG family type IV pilus assembly protein [Nevskiales bacterium]
MHSRRGESGAAALEFAIMLPLLLLMIYGIVVYSYMFIVQEAITFAAQEAAEAAVKVDPAQDPADYEAAVRAEVVATATRVLDFLPPAQRERVLGSDGSKVEVTVADSPTGIGGVVTVNLVFSFSGLFPQIPLPALGPIPPMPGTLVARGVVGV